MLLGRFARVARLIQLDGTKSASDSLELRLIAPQHPQRLIALRKGAAFIVRGRPDFRRAAATSPLRLQRLDRKKKIWKRRSRLPRAGP